MRLRTFLFAVLFVAACAPEKVITQNNTLLPDCHCEGEGKYTIILDAGMGCWSIFWKPVFNELRKTHRVCLLSRPGYLTTDVSGKPRDARTVAAEWHTMFRQKGINNNLILGGHSMGGVHVRMYQQLFPEEVKGLMLFDAAHPGQFERLPQAFRENAEKQPAALDKVIRLAQKDRLKYAKNKIPLNGIPPYLQQEYYAVTTRPQYYFTLRAETVDFAKSLAEINEKPGQLDSLPLLVMASAQSMNPAIFPGRSQNYPFELHNTIWLELQQEHRQLSSNTMYTVSQSDHYIMLGDSVNTTKAIREFYEKNF